MVVISQTPSTCHASLVPSWPPAKQPKSVHPFAHSYSHLAAPISVLLVGIILLSVLSTSCIGRSLVPTFSFSAFSRSSKRIALRARTLFATPSIV